MLKKGTKIGETKKKQNKKLIKNYLILLLIFAGTIAVTLYLCKVYQVYEEDKKQIPIISDVLYEIKTDELDHYISENPTSVLYMCTANDTNCRNYEKDLKKLVRKRNLQETLIYLNIEADEKEAFIKQFNEKYSPLLKITDNYPILVTIEDGKVTDLLQPKEDEKLTISKTTQFIELNKIGE